MSLCELFGIEFCALLGIIVSSSKKSAMNELASLDQSARESALERFRIIQPCLEQDMSLSLIGRQAGIPYRTIHRWMSRYHRFDLAGLARKAPEDRGKRRALACPTSRNAEPRAKWSLMPRALQSLSIHKKISEPRA
jgi:transposase-like protein